MSYDFNADDVLEMAEQIERNGAAFYRFAVERRTVAFDLFGHFQYIIRIEIIAHRRVCLSLSPAGCLK